MKFLNEFKDFALRGNLADIAVAFVMGAAFNKVVSSFTGGIISPLVGLLSQVDFNDQKYVFKEATVNAAGQSIGEVAVLYGAFLTNVVDFLIVAFVMFMIVKSMNRMKKKTEPASAVSKGPTQEQLLVEIRDLLKKNA